MTTAIGLGVGLTRSGGAGGGGGGGGGQDVLMLLGTIDPLSTDLAAQKAYHEAAGDTVTLKALAAGYDASDEDYDLIITEGGGNDDTIPWRTVGVPILSHGSWEVTDLLYAASGPTASFLTTTSVKVMNDTHPIDAALGWSDDEVYAVIGTAQKIPGKSPNGAGGVSFARANISGNDGYQFFTYDAGSTLLYGGSLASSRRCWVSVFRWFDDLTPDGLALYAACVDWCLGAI